MLRSKGFINFAFVTAAALAVALMFFACGEKSSEPQAQVATEDVQVQVTAGTIPILYTAPANFPDGVSEFGTTTATTLSFSANDTNAATPVFNIKTATDSAKGVTTFGSCIFTITSTTYLIGPLRLNSTVEISPCEVILETSGKAIGSDLTDVTAKFKLGMANINIPAPLVTISASGTVTIDGDTVGTVDLGTLTGGN